jgi:protein-S-isoprenylcysteine O-methyltransferase Ste14
MILAVTVNLVVRSLVWFAALAVWLRLRRPVGMDWTSVSWQPLTVVGAIVAIVGIACFLWAATALAVGVPNAVDAPARLLTRGPYAYVRNPLYLAAAGVIVGLTTMYQLWEPRDAIVLPIIGLLVHLFVVYREEPRTRDRLGPVYDTYRASVPRWIPRV